MQNIIRISIMQKSCLERCARMALKNSIRVMHGQKSLLTEWSMNWRLLTKWDSTITFVRLQTSSSTQKHMEKIQLRLARDEAVEQVRLFADFARLLKDLIQLNTICCLSVSSIQNVYQCLILIQTSVLMQEQFQFSMLKRDTVSAP